MPSYRVKQQGFHDGRLYDPNGKRRVLHTDKPLKPVPKWVEPMEEETAAQRKKRLAKEKKAAVAAKEAEQEKKKAVDAVTFTEAPATTQSNVETL